MDKTLFKAYVRTIVEEEVKKILPNLLAEAVAEVKQLSESTNVKSVEKPKIDRTKLAQLMGIEYDGETLHARGTNSSTTFVNPTAGPPEVVNAINRDYSELMKAMKLT